MSQPPRPTSAPGKRRGAANSHPPSFTLDPSLESNTNNNSNTNQQQDFTFPFERNSNNNNNHVVVVDDPSLENNHHTINNSSHQNQDQDQTYQQQNNDDVFYVQRPYNNNNNSSNNDNSALNQQQQQQQQTPPRSPHSSTNPSSQTFPSSSTILTFDDDDQSQRNNNNNNNNIQQRMYNPNINNQDQEWQHQHQRYLAAIRQSHHQNNSNTDSPQRSSTTTPENTTSHQHMMMTHLSSHNIVPELPPRTPPHTHFHLTPPQSSRSVISIDVENDVDRNQEHDEEDDVVAEEVISQHSSTTTLTNVVPGSEQPNYNYNNENSSSYTYDSNNANDGDDQLLASLMMNNNNSQLQQPRSSKRLREMLEGQKEEYYSFESENNLINGEKKQRLIDLQTEQNNGNNHQVIIRSPSTGLTSLSRHPGKGDVERAQQTRDITLQTIKTSLNEAGDHTTVVRNAVWDAIEENEMSPHNTAPSSIQTMMNQQKLQDIENHFHDPINVSNSNSNNNRKQQLIESDFIRDHHNLEGVQNVYDVHNQSKMMMNASNNMNNNNMSSLSTTSSSTISSSSAEARWSQFCSHMINTVSVSLLNQQKDEFEKEQKSFSNRKAAAMSSLPHSALTPTPKFSSSTSLFGSSPSSAFSSTKFSSLPKQNSASSMLSDTAFSTINTVKHIMNETTKFLKSEGRLNRLVESEGEAAKEVIRSAKEEAKQAQIETNHLQDHVLALKEEIAELHQEIHESKGEIKDLHDVRHKLQLSIARTASKVLGSVRAEKNKKRRQIGNGDQNNNDDGDDDNNDQNQNNNTEQEEPISVREKDPLYYVEILESVAAEAFQLRTEMDAALFIATQQTEWAIKEGQEAERIVHRLANAREQLQECSTHMMTMRNYISKLEQQLGPLKQREFSLQTAEHAMNYHDSALWSSFTFGNNLNASHADALESAIRGFLRSSLLSSGKVAISALPGFNLTQNTNNNASSSNQPSSPAAQLMAQMDLNSNNNANSSSGTAIAGSGNPTIVDTSMQRGQYPNDAFSLLPQKLLVGVGAVNTIVNEAHPEVLLDASLMKGGGNPASSFMGKSGTAGAGRSSTHQNNNNQSQNQQSPTAANKDVTTFNRLQIVDGIAQAEKKLVNAIVHHHGSGGAGGGSSSPSPSNASPATTSLSPPTSSSSSTAVFPIESLLPVAREILSKFHSWPEGRLSPAKLSMNALFDGLLRSIQSNPSNYPSFLPPSPSTPMKARIRICSDYVFSLLASMHHQSLVGYSECFLIYSTVTGQAPLGSLKALPRLAERLFVRLQSNVSAGLLGGAGGDGAGQQQPSANTTTTKGGGNKTTKSSKRDAANAKDATVPRDVFLRTVKDMFPRASEASLLALALLTFTDSSSHDPSAIGGGAGGGKSSKHHAAAAAALANIQQQDAVHYVPYFKDRDHANPGLVLTAIYRMALDEQRKVLEELQHAICQAALKRYHEAREAEEELAQETGGNQSNSNNTQQQKITNETNMDKFMSTIRAVSGALSGSGNNNMMMKMASSSMKRADGKNNNNNSNSIMTTQGGVELFDEKAIEAHALVSLREIGVAVFQVNPHCPHKEMIKIVSVACGDPNIESDYMTRMKTNPSAKLTMVSGTTGAKQPMEMNALKKTVRVADAILRIRNVLFLEMYDRLSVEADE